MKKAAIGDRGLFEKCWTLVVGRGLDLGQVDIDVDILVSAAEHAATKQPYRNDRRDDERADDEPAGSTPAARSDDRRAFRRFLFHHFSFPELPDTLPAPGFDKISPTNGHRKETVGIFQRP